VRSSPIADADGVGRSGEILQLFQATHLVGLGAEVGTRASGPKSGRKPSRKVLRRLERIEGLPAHQQSALFKSIDLMLKGVAS